MAGSSRFITEDFPEEFEGNRTFFLNAIDWLTIGDELIDIRSRAAGETAPEACIRTDKTDGAHYQYAGSTAAGDSLRFSIYRPAPAPQAP